METPASCIHCAVQDAIAGYYESRGDRHGDHTVLNLSEVLDGIEQVVGELLAGVPNPEKRTHIFECFVSNVVYEVNEALAAKRHPILLELS